MKEYSEEFRCYCLVISLLVVLFSPDAVSAILEQITIDEGVASGVLTYAAFTSFVYGLGVIANKLIPYGAKDWILYP